MTHLDPSGKKPVLDAKGRLAQPFVLRLPPLEDGTLRGSESWGVGLILPLTPAAHAAWAAEVEAARAKRHPQPALEAKSAFKTTAKGKRKRKADDELTPAQLKRRQYNIKRNAEKKRRNA
jgi:hypothetical protein